MAKAKTTIRKKSVLKGKKVVKIRKKIVSRKKKTVSPRKKAAQKASLSQTTLWLMVKDPYGVFATWKIPSEDLEKLKAKMKRAFPKAIRVLRVYDVTQVEFNGKNANSYFDIDVGKADHWHIPLRRDGIQCCVEIGLKTKKEEFFSLARSQTVETPCAHPSLRTEEIWMTVTPSSKEGPHQNAFYSSVKDMKQEKKIYLSRDDIRRYYKRSELRLRDLMADRLRALYGMGFHRLRLAGESKEEKDRVYAMLQEEQESKGLRGASEARG